MPLLRKYSFNGAEIAIWHITEPVGFFDEQTFAIKQILHQGKRQQHMAAWFTAILLHPTLKPAYHINGYPVDKLGKKNVSLSHIRGFAAAALHQSTAIGIDIELISDKAFKLLEKFANEVDKSVLRQHHLLNPIGVTLLWCIKEAMYKLKHETGIDFKKVMTLQELQQHNDITFHLSCTWKGQKLTGIAYLIENIWCVLFVDNQ